jgi:hypothetical protein
LGNKDVCAFNLCVEGKFIFRFACVCLEVNMEIPNFLFHELFSQMIENSNPIKMNLKKNENLRRKETILHTCEFTKGFLIHIVEEKK